jgi:hypothetical protein
MKADKKEVFRTGMKFWAHSDPTGLPPEAAGAPRQTLAEHLQNAAALAKRLAKFDRGELRDK